MATLGFSRQIRPSSVTAYDTNLPEIVGGVGDQTLSDDQDSTYVRVQVNRTSGGTRTYYRAVASFGPVDLPAGAVVTDVLITLRARLVQTGNVWLTYDVAGNIASSGTGTYMPYYVVSIPNYALTTDFASYTSASTDWTVKPDAAAIEAGSIDVLFYPGTNAPEVGDRFVDVSEITLSISGTYTTSDAPAVPTTQGGRYVSGAYWTTPDPAVPSQIEVLVTIETSTPTEPVNFTTISNHNTGYSHRPVDVGTTYVFQSDSVNFFVDTADIIADMRAAYPSLNVLVAFQAWWFVDSAANVFYDTGSGWQISTANGSEDAVGYGTGVPTFPGMTLLAVQDTATVLVDDTNYTMRLGLWWADSVTLGTPETIDTSDLVGCTAKTAMMIFATAGTQLEVYDQAAYPVNTIPGIPYDHVVALLDDYVYWNTGNTGSGPMYASITTPTADYTDTAGMGYIRAVATLHATNVEAVANRLPVKDGDILVVEYAHYGTVATQRDDYGWTVLFGELVDSSVPGVTYWQYLLPYDSIVAGRSDTWVAVAPDGVVAIAADPRGPWGTFTPAVDGDSADWEVGPWKVKYGNGDWVMTSGGDTIWVSSDPSTLWTQYTVPGLSAVDGIWQLTYTNSQWVIVPTDSAIVIVSPNPRGGWETVTPSGDYWGGPIAFGNGRWVQFNSQSMCVASSLEGPWTYIGEITPTWTSVEDLVFADGLFVAIGDYNNYTVYFTNPLSTSVTWIDTGFYMSEEMLGLSYGGGVWFITCANGKYSVATLPTYTRVRWDEWSMVVRAFELTWATGTPGTVFGGTGFEVFNDESDETYARLGTGQMWVRAKGDTLADATEEHSTGDYQYVDVDSYLDYGPVHPGTYPDDYSYLGSDVRYFDVLPDTNDSVTFRWRVASGSPTLQMRGGWAPLYSNQTGYGGLSATLTAADNDWHTVTLNHWTNTNPLSGDITEGEVMSWFWVEGTGTVDVSQVYWTFNGVRAVPNGLPPMP